MSAHEHLAQTTSLSLPAMLAIGGTIVATGIVLAPYVAPIIGLGSTQIAASSLVGMHEVAAGVGLAGGFSSILSYIPLVGQYLAQGGIANIVATAAVGIGGTIAGHWISRQQSDKRVMDWGKVITWGALATSALIALPSILSGLSTGLIYAVQELSAQQWIAAETTGKMLVDAVLATLGTFGYQEPLNIGLAGSAAILPHLLTCGASMVPLAVGIGTHEWLEAEEYETPFVARDTRGNPLPLNDPNHDMTAEERQLVDRYNGATPAQKILLQREILARGYTPDFHSNGTVHLYQHPHHAHTTGPSMG